MAVTFDSATASGPSTSASSISWAHTLGGGSNLVAIIPVAAAGGTLRTVSSVTYGAQNASQVPSSRQTSGTDFCELWYVIGPSGDQTVTVTLSGSQSALAAGIIVVAGADQSAPLETAKIGTGSAAALTLSGIVSDVNELVVGGALDDFNASGWTWAISTGTSRFTVGSGSGLIGLVGGTQTGANPSATMAWTESGGANNSTKLASAVSIKVFSGGGFDPSAVPWAVQAPEIMTPAIIEF